MSREYLKTPGRSLGNGYFIISKMVRKWGPYWWLLKYIDGSHTGGGHSKYKWRCLGPTIECQRTKNTRLTLEEAIEKAHDIMNDVRKTIPIREGEKESLAV